MRSRSPCTAALNLPDPVSLYRLSASTTGGMPGTVVTAGAAGAALAAAAGALACACARDAANQASVASASSVAAVAVARPSRFTGIPRLMIVSSRLGGCAGACADRGHRRSHDLFDAVTAQLGAGAPRVAADAVDRLQRLRPHQRSVGGPRQRRVGQASMPTNLLRRVTPCSQHVIEPLRGCVVLVQRDHGRCTAPGAI